MMAFAFLVGVNQEGDGDPLWFVAPLASSPGILLVVLVGGFMSLMTLLVLWHDISVATTSGRLISLSRAGISDRMVATNLIAWSEIEEVRYRQFDDFGCLLRLHLKVPRSDLATPAYRLMYRLGLMRRTVYIAARLGGPAAHTFRETVKALAEAGGTRWNGRFIWAYFDSFGLGR